MKHFTSLTLSLTVMLISSACGARVVQVAPTMSAADMLSTAGAVAFTMVAETQSAIPTATPPPPTETSTNTPVPVNTLPPLSSSQVALTPVPTSNAASGDPCLTTVLPASLPGEPVKMRINNSTNVALRVSVYLNQTVPQGQCGYRAYNLDPGQFVVINDLVVGCYTLWAWNPDPQGYFIVTNGTTCVNSTDTWAFDISTRSIKPRT